MSIPSVCVITAATGHANLRKCIESIQQQTYANVYQLLVIDGPDRAEAVDRVLQRVSPHDRLKVLTLPQAVGKDFRNGNRIYGAMPWIVMTDYVCWLDEDNWFDPDHVASLVNVIQSSGRSWAFALRKIVDAEGNVLALDQCESLGTLHSTILSDKDRLVDTNCYMVNRNVAIQTSGSWNRGRRTRTNIGGDRVLCRILMRIDPLAKSSCKYSVNYTAGSTPESVKLEFFLRGNAEMRARYPNGLPWEQSTSA